MTDEAENLLDDAHRRAQAYRASLPERAVFPSAPALQALEVLDEPLSDRGHGAAATLALLDAVGSPATVASAGPRYFGFVIGGTLVGLQPAGMRGDLATIAGTKLLLHPAAVLVGLLLVPGIDAPLRSAALVYAAAPMLSIFPVLAQRFGLDKLCAAALLVALRTGSLGADLKRLPPGEQALVADALDPDPQRRPDAATLLQRLQLRVADARELTAQAAAPAVPGAMSEPGAPAAGVVVEAGPAWSDAELDLLLASDAARLQPVLDRDGRRIVLADWPDGCMRLADDADARALLPLIAELGPLAPLLRARVVPSAWVRTAAGEWMLALDCLLPR